MATRKPIQETWPFIEVTNVVTRDKVMLRAPDVKAYGSINGQFRIFVGSFEPIDSLGIQETIDEFEAMLAYRPPQLAFRDPVSSGHGDDPGPRGTEGPAGTTRKR